MKVMPMLFVLLGLSVCLGTAQEPPTRAKELAACGPIGDKLKVDLSKGQALQELSSAEARIVIIQQPQQKVIPNCGIITRYGLDGSWVGANCSKSYLVLTVSPGMHQLCGERQTKLLFRGQAVALKTLDLKGGTTSYYKSLVNIQAPADSALDLEAADEAEAKFVMSRFEEAHLKK